MNFSQQFPASLPLPAAITDLRLNYFLVDVDNRLWRLPADLFEAIWHGAAGIDTMELEGERIDCGDSFRVITVLSDGQWRPIVTFLLRSRVRDGRLVVADRYGLYRALSGNGSPQLESELMRHHLGGWPANWQSQLGVAMDVPSADFNRVSIGGPLVMADLWNMPVDTVMAHFERSVAEPGKGPTKTSDNITRVDGRNL